VAWKISSIGSQSAFTTLFGWLVTALSPKVAHIVPFSAHLLKNLDIINIIVKLYRLVYSICTGVEFNKNNK